MRQCRDLIDQDKLETLFRVYGFTDNIRPDMDGVSSRDSYAEIPSTPAFAVRPKSSLEIKLGNISTYILSFQKIERFPIFSSMFCSENILW